MQKQEYFDIVFFLFELVFFNIWLIKLLMLTFRRLETIFEVPQNRRDGSQTDVGQKKVKRFVEFPELGVARKPKKPLVVGMAGGGAHRKAGGNSGISRTRRGVGASPKVEDALTLQELDSLLCSKLEELDTWMALQQVAC